MRLKHFEQMLVSWRAMGHDDAYFITNVEMRQVWVMAHVGQQGSMRTAQLLGAIKGGDVTLADDGSIAELRIHKSKANKMKSNPR